MKRSEVIRIISQYVVTDRINPPLDNYDQERARLDAEELLTLLESLGMLPPYNPIGSEALEGHIMYCNWEPEESEEPKNYLCRKCNGSGEGYYDGTVCDACKGSGVES